MIKKLFLTLLLIFSIAASTQIVNAQVITGEEIEALAINRIETILDERGDMRRREINFLRRMYDQPVPDGNAQIEITVPGQINYAGMTSVTARYKVDGRVVKVINFVVQVRVYDTVLVASRDLMFDKNLSESDFRFDEITVDGRNEYIKDFTLIKELVPMRTIRAGSPVTLSMFRTAQVIQINQPVRLHIKYHGVEASAKGIAMARGRVGEMIRVRNESSGKIITGKVIDGQTVEVIF